MMPTLTLAGKALADQSTIDAITGIVIFTLAPLSEPASSTSVGGGEASSGSSSTSSSIETPPSESKQPEISREPSVNSSSETSSSKAIEKSQSEQKKSMTVGTAATIAVALGAGGFLTAAVIKAIRKRSQQTMARKKILQKIQKRNRL